VSSLISVDAVEKRYGERRALRGVSFGVAEGEIVGLLGPNGAGKSTMLGILASILAADGGSATVAGCRLPAQAAEARKVVGFVPQSEALYPTLSANENLEFFARMLGLGRAAAAAAIARVLALVELEDRAREPIAAFSVGMRRRLNLACGLLHEPRVLLLDEPTVGVDPQSRERIFEAVRGLADRGTAVLYSTHGMEEAERLCGRIVLLDGGAVMAEGTTAELVAAAHLVPRIRVATRSALPDGWLREKILFGQKLHVGRELVLRIKGGIDPDGVGVEFPHASRKAKNQKRPLGLLDSTDHLNFSCSGDCALWKADDH